MVIENVDSRIGLLFTSGLGVAALAFANTLPWLIAVLVMCGFVAVYIFVPTLSRSAQSLVRQVRFLVFPLVLVPTLLLSQSPGVVVRVVILAALVCATALFVAVQLTSRREQLLGLGLAAMMLVLAAGTGSGLPLLLVTMVGWLGTLLTLVLIVQATYDVASADARQAARDEGRRGLRARALLRQSAAAIGLATACGLVLFLLTPDVEVPTNSALLSGSAIDQSGLAQPRESGTYVGGGVDLRSRGDLPTEPLIEVPQESPEYWRAATMDVYDRGTWGESMTRQPEVIPVGSSVLKAPQRGSSGARDSVTSYGVTVLSGYRGAAIAPGDIVSLNSASGAVRSQSGTTYLTSGVSNYSIESTRVPAVSEISPKARGDLDEPAPSEYTFLPASVPSRVRTLGQSLVAGAPSRAAAVTKVEEYVRTNAKYLLDAPVAPLNADPVDYFLFESQLGYCEHFASAEVVLLRSAGIPARLATGFINGEQTSEGKRAFRGVDGHAWVEVWMPGTGWVRSDPTTGAVHADDGQSWLADAVEWASQALSDQRKRFAFALVLLVSLIAGAWAARWFASRRRERAPSEPDWSMVEPPEPLAAFSRLERVLARRGRPRRPAETPGELAARLPMASARAVRTVVQACYSWRVPSDRDRILAAEELDQVARSIATEPVDAGGSGEDRHGLRGR